MNEFILCVMDKRKTKQELLENFNASAAADASAAAYAYFAAYYAAADAAAGAAYSAASAASAAAYAAAADADSLEYYLSEYFEITGEDRKDYEKEIAKNE